MAGGVGIAFAPIFVRGSEVGPLSTAFWRLALVSRVGEQGLIAYALRHLAASFSSVTLLIQPVGAMLLAWRFFGEAIGAKQGLGAVVIILGILLARAGSRPGAAALPHPTARK